MKVYECAEKDKNGNWIVDHEIEFDLIDGGKRLSYKRILKVMEFVEDMMKKNDK